MKNYVTPTDYFTTKFRQIFTNTKTTFRTARYAQKWLARPQMSFWPQQLNFAFWCATTGCGVSREILLSSGSSLKLTPQIHSFYLFHVYYTTRKILYKIRGIQSKGASPDDPVFNQRENPCDVAAYKRICAEFGLDPNTDFRYKKGSNHGLGKVFINITRGGSVPTGMSYPSAKAKFSDEGGDAGEGNLAAFIRNDDGTDKQFEYFAPNRARGFTDIGLARINQSSQAFCYSVLGAQANSHTIIIGDSGSAKNAQLDFLILVEDAIKTLYASNGPVKYQDAMERTKTRLDFAIARGVLLMPSRMIINTESIVGYNKNLTRVTDDMKLGVNNHVNLGSKNSSLKPMAGGPSKINPPNSHPSNPIHKKATEAQGLVKKKPPTIQTPATDTPTTDTSTTTKEDPVDTHHVNKALVGFGALVFVGFVIWASK